jgi:very-short-patch-repair endonuclease
MQRGVRRGMKSDLALTPSPSPAERERGDPQEWSADQRPPRWGRPHPILEVKGAAQQMRREPTGSESLLWSALRNRRLAGRKFRRQHAVGRFILDFYCHEERLAVEVDGSVHEMQRGADRERQAILEDMGIRFLRLPAWLIERDLPAALFKIETALTPSPSPAERERGDPQGRGEGV